MLTRLLFFYQTFPSLTLLCEIYDYVYNLTIMEILEGGKYVSLRWCARVLMKGRRQLL